MACCVQYRVLPFLTRLPSPYRRWAPSCWWAPLALFGLWGSQSVHAAPFRPASDAQVLETLPARATEPRMRDLLALRRQLAADPHDVNLAVRLARRYFDEVAAEGDPRYIGYAEAALGPWWNAAEPPTPVRTMRALLRQFTFATHDD